MSWLVWYNPLLFPSIEVRFQLRRAILDYVSLRASYDPVTAITFVITLCSNDESEQVVSVGQRVYLRSQVMKDFH